MPNEEHKNKTAKTVRWSLLPPRSSNMVDQQLYADLRFFLLTLKLDPEQQREIENYIRSNGGKLATSHHDADFIVTCLKSPGRIVRHVEGVHCPVVHVDWILSCMKNNRLNDPDGYVIDMSSVKTTIKRKASVVVISSDEELPRQLKWDQIQDAYGSKCNGPVSVSHIMDGHRAKKARVQHEDSYQTTSQSSIDFTVQSSSSFSSFEFDFAASQEGTSDEDDDMVSVGSTASKQDDDPRVRNPGKYACQRPCTWNPYNRELVEVLEFLEYARNLRGDDINGWSYRIACSVIKCYPRQIKSIDQVKHLHGIGKKTARIIDDFLRTGSVPDIEMLKKDEDFQTLERFYKVHGVGSATAREWLCKGYRTLEDVSKNEKLTHEQKLGIKYYDHFIQKIPRKEVEDIGGLIKAILEKEFPGCEHTICGSYRRGKLFSGDVDVVITHKDIDISSKLLLQLLEILKTQGLVIDILSMGSDCQERDGDDDYLRPDQALCVWQQPGSKVIRRVDLIVTPYTNYPISILAWTGSSHFERSIRLYAKKERNLKFSQNGIYSRITDERIPVTSERHAFEILGLKYLEPEERDC